MAGQASAVPISLELVFYTYPGLSWPERLAVLRPTFVGFHVEVDGGGQDPGSDCDYGGVL